MTETLRLRVAAIAPEAEGILSYELVPAGPGSLPPFEAGAHLQVQVPGGAVRSYSLCSDPQETHRYLIAVQRERQGRGGSQAMHERVGVGEVLTTSLPRNGFPLLAARRYLLVAGGIGITPLLSMVHALRRSRAEWRLHYCTRSPQRTAFRKVLAEPQLAERVVLHHDGGDPTRGVDVERLVADRPAGARLYCCGPAGLMRAVREAAHRHGWPEEKVHFESFSAEGMQAVAGVVAGGEPGAFEVGVCSTGEVYPVGPGETVLGVLRQHGVGVPSDCEAGQCGTCLTRVLEGEPEHRDSLLSAQERAEGRLMLVCVSRARSRRLVLDL